MAGSTPIYGFPYPQSTDLVADYPTLGQELATDVETVISGLGSGLNIITPTSIANSGGSATSTSGTTTFTNVSSISLNGCFSATYENYFVIVTNVTGSASTSLITRMRASGTDSATGYNSGGSYNGSASGNIIDTNAIGQYMDTIATSGNGNQQMIFFMPFLAISTGFMMQSYRDTLTNVRFGRHTPATSYDGFSMITASGTMSGKVRVYGYKGA